MQLNQLAEFKAHPRHAQAVAFSNDGSELVTTGMDAVAQVWSVPEFECLRTMDSHDKSVNAVDLSPDGRLAITGSTDRKVMVWEWDSCEVLHTMGGYRNTVAAAAFSPAGDVAVTASYDGRIGFWDKRLGYYGRGHISSQKRHFGQLLSGRRYAGYRGTR